MKHLFIIDQPQALNIEIDTSLQLALAFIEQGDQVYFAFPHELAWQTGSTSPLVFYRQGECGKGRCISFASKEQQAALGDFDAIHMRKDPPFDINYINLTWMLDTARKDAVLINDSHALRDINEKFSILQYSDLAIPSLVSSSSSALFDFFKNHTTGKAVLKPLDLYGGRGVILLESDGTAEQDLAVTKTITQETGGNSCYRMIQPFLEEIYTGEVRCFAAGGEPVAWTRKIPAKGTFMATTRMGATSQEYEPTATEVEKLRKLSQSLLQKGVSLVGYDLIAGKVSEINITSPRLLAPSNQFVERHQIAATKLREFILNPNIPRRG
jgi:glutathione synthase